jgi:excisionase family DNA binding protein
MAAKNAQNQTRSPPMPKTQMGRSPLAKVPTPKYPTIDDSRLAFSMREAANAIGCSERSIWSLVNAGRIPSFRVGRSVRIRREDLEAFMASGGSK